jgi:hypothetical protein
MTYYVFKAIEYSFDLSDLSQLFKSQIYMSLCQKMEVFQ